MNYIIPILFFIFFFLEAFPQKPDFLEKEEEQLLVWNVGQGQMVTYLTPTHCYHFDMGGEKFPQKELFRVCQNKKNEIRYTHFDWDHINFSKKAQRIFPSICRVSLSPLPRLTKRKNKMILSLSTCPSHQHPHIRHLNMANLFPEQIKNSNDSSVIFIIKNKILIPGDSSSHMESFWVPLIQEPIQILIMGHHGSKYSTSSFLIESLPSLKMALSSARFKRYGHPHPSTQRRLNKKGILSIRTEDKGHIRIPLDSKSSLKYSVF